MVTVPAPKDDIEEILTGIMAKQSPLMKQAKTQGQQAAQQMGLGQSTMGIGAAQKAAYNVALPMASQASSQAHAKGMQGTQIGHEAEQNELTRGLQRWQTEFEGQHKGAERELQSVMQQRALEQQKQMQGAQFGHEAGMQTQSLQHAATQAQADRSLQSWMKEFEGQHKGAERALQAHLAAQEISARERVASMEINAADKERALSAVTQFNNTYAAAMSQIVANENLPAPVRESYSNYLNELRSHNINLTTSLYRNTVPW